MEKLKKKIKEIYNLSPDIKSVRLGIKEKDGVSTGQVGIVVGVEKKKKLEELNPSEVIPKSYWIGTNEYITDVIETPNIVFIACPSQCNPPECATNCGSVRPLQAGVEIGSTYNPGYVGTLGIIAVDTVSNCLVGVTNSHVTHPTANQSSREYTTYQNLLNGPFVNAYDKEVRQPYGSSGIGKIVRYVPLYPNIDNRVDASMISLYSSVIDNTVSFKQYLLGYNSPMEFATTAEIDALLSTHSSGGIYSSGRTSGPKGPGVCELRITGINVYVDPGFPFENSISYKRVNVDCGNPVRGGDSGSALIADFGGTWKIIGLVYAGSCIQVTNTCSEGFACRIDDVANELSITAWDGTAKPFVSKMEFITVPGGSSSDIITCNGKEYWQMGLTTNSSPCS